MTNSAYERDDSAGDWAGASIAPYNPAVQGSDWRVLISSPAEVTTLTSRGLLDELAGTSHLPVVIDHPHHGTNVLDSPIQRYRGLTKYEDQMRSFGAAENEDFRKLNREYLLENRSEVEMFIHDHRSTVGILLEAVPNLRAAFGAEAILQLRVGIEEETTKVIYGIVIWKESLDSARSALRQFDDSWWLNNVKRASGRIVFDYELA